jgi:phage gpG-like protein
MESVIKVDSSRVALAFAAFRLGLKQREELMRAIGAGELVSVFRTFDEAGSPSGSWPPLSPNSLRWNKYSAGHKLLIKSGLMRNSNTFTVAGDSVSIGTDMLRARIHNDGWEGDQNVRAHSYTRRVKSQDRFGRVGITNKQGAQQNVRRKLVSGITTVNVRAFTRHIRIPRRRWLVFRPEDPQRISNQVTAFLIARADGAGLRVQ